MVGQRALCVGINKFQNIPQGYWLNGCVNDATDMVSILKKYLGFTDGDIVSLTDDQATKANIMANLKEMVDGANKGMYNYLFFSISSHGTQVPDSDRDEPDYADEALCPTDLAQKGDKWDPDHIIIDDELNALFSQLSSSVDLECVFDTCHSGDGVRAIDLLLDRKPRFLPPPSIKAFEQIKDYTPRSIAVSLKAKLLKAKSMEEKGIGVEHILWSACKSDQVSLDAKIDGVWHGAFTYYFCKNINKKQNNLARDDLLKLVREDLEGGSFTQIPQLDTKATKRDVSPGLIKGAIPSMA